MQELRNLETSQLVDLLARHTADYTKMISAGTTGDEYTMCNLIIKALQIEIRSRNTNTSETNITAPPDFS